MSAKVLDEDGVSLNEHQYDGYIAADGYDSLHPMSKLVLDLVATIRDRETKLADERRLADALVASMPKCGGWCGDCLATHRDAAGHLRCDYCVMAEPDLPYAAPLRALLAARKAGTQIRTGRAPVEPWEDAGDEHDAAIKAAHPTRTNTDAAHERYGVAMRMVGKRHSKGKLVTLVHWLLTERDAAKEHLAMATRLDIGVHRVELLADGEWGVLDPAHFIASFPTLQEAIGHARSLEEGEAP